MLSSSALFMVDSLPLGEICWHWQRENEVKKIFFEDILWIPPRQWTKVYFSFTFDWTNKFWLKETKIEILGNCFVLIALAWRLSSEWHNDAQAYRLGSSTIQHWEQTAIPRRKKMFFEDIWWIPPRWWTKVYFSFTFDWTNKFWLKETKIEFLGNCFVLIALASRLSAEWHTDAQAHGQGFETLLRWRKENGGENIFAQSLFNPFPDDEPKSFYPLISMEQHT